MSIPFQPERECAVCGRTYLQTIAIHHCMRGVSIRKQPRTREEYLRMLDLRRDGTI